jgi:hypothetical protein
MVATALICEAGFGAASWLTSHVVTPPVISFVDGQRAVRPPRLPGYLGFSWCLLNFLVLVRVTRSWRRARSGRPFRPVTSGELLGWIFALAMTTPLAQWATLTSHYGTGLPPTPGMSLVLIVTLTFNNFTFLIGAMGKPAGPSRPELSAQP